MAINVGTAQHTRADVCVSVTDVRLRLPSLESSTLIDSPMSSDSISGLGRRRASGCHCHLGALSQQRVNAR
jgi:hypothetical protein